MIRLKYPKFWNDKNLISLLLTPFSVLYFVFSLLRKFIAIFCKVDLGVSIICIGNITVGGTGKTQVVKWLYEKLSTKFNILIISKGFGGSFEGFVLVQDSSDPKIVGDEAKEIFTHTKAKVLVVKNIRKIKQIVSEIKPNLIIMDDFLQNPYIKKDVKITVIDGNRVFGNNLLIPSGPMREMFIFHKSDFYLSVGNKNDKHGDVAHYFCDEKYYESIITPKNKDESFDSNKKYHKKYYAFAGIGNFKRFLNTLSIAGYNVVDYMEYQDHHHYSEQDVDFLNNLSKTKGLTLITTSKDRTKIENQLLDFETLDINLDIKNEDDLVSSIISKIV